MAPLRARGSTIIVLMISCRRASLSRRIFLIVISGAMWHVA